MDTISNPERRASRRSTVSLSTIVKGHESTDIFWKETTVINTVSRTGASFILQREYSIGRLLSLIMPMPKHLRCYDYDTEFYRVWGLVQHCTPVSNEIDSGFHVGISFIGKYAPSSYKENPLNSYRVSGISEEGLWKISEAPRAFVSRKAPRFNMDIEVRLSISDDEGDIINEENTNTVNISSSGAAVISSFEVMVGDQINFNCPDFDFSSLAIVRNHQVVSESVSILNLEFIENEFPIRDTSLPLENPAEVDEILKKLSVLKQEQI